MTEQLLVKAKANNKVQAHVLGFIQADDKARPLTSRARTDTNNSSTGGSWLGTPLCLTTNTNGATYNANTHMRLLTAGHLRMYPCAY